VQGTAAGVLAVTQGIALDVTQAGTGCVGCVVNPEGGLTRNLAGKWDGWSGTAGFQWRPNDDTNLYLRYARGYKAGGFIASANMAPGVYAEPEYLNSYELGWKQTFGGRLQFNSAVFYYDYTDFQAPLSVQLPGGGGSLFATQFVNLDAEVKGVEVETMWSLRDHARLLFPRHGGSDGDGARRTAGGCGRRTDARRQLDAELAGFEVHGGLQLHLELRPWRLDVRQHLELHA
jgi:outer membrane receptor protein involved in Fe transport